MTKLMHSLPWTLALGLAAQAGEAEAIRVPDAGAGMTQESCLATESPETVESALRNPGFDPVLYARLKKSLEM